MIYNILSIMTLILSALLGGFVYLNDKNNKVNKIFVFLIFCTMLWIFSNYMTDNSTDISTIKLWSKVTILGPVLFGYVFFKLSLVFPPEKKISKKTEVLNTFLVLIFII